MVLPTTNLSPRTANAPAPVALDVPDQRRFARPWWVLAVVGLGYAGYVKGTPAIADLPVDLTAVMSVVCVVGVVVVVIRGYWFQARVLSAILVLWVVFGVGALMVAGTEGESKVALLGTVTLLCAVMPCYLLTNAVAHRWLLVSTMVAATIFIAGAMLMPDTVARDTYGRFNLDGTSTIGTGRVVGAGILVATVFALTSPSRRWIWWLAAAAGTGALVAVGSRGPFVSLLASAGAVVLLAKAFTGRRIRAVGLGALAVSVLALVVITSSSPSADRIRLLLTGDETDVAREFLVRETWSNVIHHPLGLGWGGFSSIKSIELASGGQPAYPHNLILEIFLEGGWLAGALFLVLVFYSMRGFVRASDSPDRTALLGLGVYWFAVAQTSSDINGNRMTWIMLTVGLVLAFRASTASRDVGTGRFAGQSPAGS